MDFIALHCKWRKCYEGITDSSLQELKELRKENDSLKKMYANLSLENNALKDLIVLLIATKNEHYSVKIN